MAREDHVIHLENGQLTEVNAIEKIREMAQKGVDNGHIVIHFHGGLVPYSRGIQIVEHLLPEYLSAHTFPMFFVWESGLIETLTNNFEEIAKEKLFRILWKRISAIVTRKFGQSQGERAAFVLPALDTGPLEESIDKALDEQDLTKLTDSEAVAPSDLGELSDFERTSLEGELLMDPQLNIELEKVTNGLRNQADVEDDLRSRSPRVQGSSATLMDPRSLSRLVERPAPGDRGLVSVAKLIKAVVTISAQVVSRFVKDRDHGFHATVVEELLRELYLANVGEFIWNNMKKDTADAFGNDADRYGGSALLVSLAAIIKPENPPRITLVGHSTGAIYISKFIDKAAQLLPSNQRYDVIFLAPASNCELTAATLQQHGGQIGNFRMFTMSDEFERQDELVKILYPRSLLYFVSGVVEGGFDVPLVGMARFYDQARFPDVSFPSVAAVRDYVNEDPRRVVWSVNSTGQNGRRSAAVKHGDFDNDQQTIDSIAHILAQGFQNE